MSTESDTPPSKKVLAHRVSANKYAAKNREKIRAYSKRHYIINKVKIAARKKARRERLKAEKLAAELE